MTASEARLEHLEELRRHELMLVAAFIPACSRILEIGAGSGWQSKLLAELGHEVHALDLPQRRKQGVQHFPVADYDGVHIPFPDQYFDVVFSSNVLEHIPHLESFQREIFRILRVGGIAVHILPSPAWRFWTLMGHHLYIARLIVGVIGRYYGTSDEKTGEEPAALSRKMREKWRNIFWPSRHGESGNAFTELYLFSGRCWKSRFEDTGWTVKDRQSLGIFYTGNQLLHRRLSLGSRRILARFLGSATQVFWLTAL